MKLQLTKTEKVALAGYVLTGDVETAYLMCRPNAKCSKENTRRMALRWLRGEMQQAYIKEMREKQRGMVQEAAEGVDLTNKDNLLRALQNEYRSSTDPKDRAAILGRIADISRMDKREEEKEVRPLVHYFIPAPPRPRE